MITRSQVIFNVNLFWQQLCRFLLSSNLIKSHLFGWYIFSPLDQVCILWVRHSFCIPGSWSRTEYRLRCQYVSIDVMCFYRHCTVTVTVTQSYTSICRSMTDTTRLEIVESDKFLRILTIHRTLLESSWIVNVIHQRRSYWRRIELGVSIYKVRQNKTPLHENSNFSEMSEYASYVLNKLAKFGAKIFTYFWQIVVFVLGHFILTHHVFSCNRFKNCTKPSATINSC